MKKWPTTKKEKRTYVQFSSLPTALLLLVCLSLIHPNLNAQWVSISRYTLVQQAVDILIIKVDRIEGQEYGEKAIVHFERSLKRRIHSDSLELPFVYTGYRTAKDTYVEMTEIVPVSFEAGKRYVVFLAKWRKTSFNPHAAEAEYEVRNYPKDTFFEVTADNDPRIVEIEQLLNVVDESNFDPKLVLLLSMIQSNRKETRIDAIEALADLKAEKGAGAFISVLRDDPDSTVRSSAAQALWYPHADSIDGVLMGCLQQEKAGLVRYQIIQTLGRRHAIMAVPMLLGIYETSAYNQRNAILETVCRLADSTVVPPLMHLFSIDNDTQHRHVMAQTISSFHTSGADEFSTALLDTARSYWLKSAVMEGWTQSTYREGFSQISKWTSVPCPPGDSSSKARGDMQGLAFPLLRAIEKLGTPEQIASTLKVYSSCNDPVIRQTAVRILKKQLAKSITTELRVEIENVVKTFPPQ